MACRSSSCNAKTREDKRGLLCAICLGFYHTKCVALPSKIVDTIRDSDGLQWVCYQCKSFSSDIPKIYCYLKTGFTEIKNDLAKTMAKLNKYESYLNNLSHADNRKNLSLAENSRANSEPLLFNATSPLPSSHPAVSASTSNGNGSSAAAVSASTSNVNGSSAAAPILQSANLHINTVDLTGHTANVHPSNVAANNAVVEATHEHQDANHADHNDGTTPAPKPLVAASIRKNIFVSRLAADTSEIDVHYYISSKIPQASNISVHKYRFNFDRKISSFKILIPEELLDSVLDKDFWPSGIIARLYEFRERQQRNRPGNPRYVSERRDAQEQFDGNPASSHRDRSKNARRPKITVERT